MSPVVVVRLLRPVLLGLTAFVALAGPLASPAAATRNIFIWYPDGGPLPASAKICQGQPPAFECRSGANLDECRRGVQALLDRWYADFDVTFVYEEPTSGEFDTVVVASSGAWCGAGANVSSRSPLPICTANPARSVAIFHCGNDAKLCATLIAKEHAHLWGLQHTGSSTDVMSAETSLDHAGFEDVENLSDRPTCGRLQNSYRLLLERLGPWAGGMKPEPAPPTPPETPIPDAAPPEMDAAELPDAAAEGPSPTATADGGCGCAVGARPSSGSAAASLSSMLALVLVVSARRASRSRSCRREGRPWPGGAAPPRDRG